jgi:hypothetical protein
LTLNINSTIPKSPQIFPKQPQNNFLTRTMSQHRRALSVRSKTSVDLMQKRRLFYGLLPWVFNK